MHAMVGVLFELLPVSRKFSEPTQLYLLHNAPCLLHVPYVRCKTTVGVHGVLRRSAEDDFRTVVRVVSTRLARLARVRATYSNRAPPTNRSSPIKDLLVGGARLARVDRLSTPIVS